MKNEALILFVSVICMALTLTCFSWLQLLQNEQIEKNRTHLVKTQEKLNEVIEKYNNHHHNKE